MARVFLIAVDGARLAEYKVVIQLQENSTSRGTQEFAGIKKYDVQRARYNRKTDEGCGQLEFALILG